MSCDQHVIFVLVAVIAWIIPDIPEKVRLEIMKEIMLASEAQLKRREKEEEEEEEKEGRSSMNDAVWVVDGVQELQLVTESMCLWSQNVGDIALYAGNIDGYINLRADTCIGVGWSTDCV